MKVRSPIVTLIAGATTAAVLLVMNTIASSDARDRAAGSGAPAPATSSAPATGTPPVSSSPGASVTTAPAATRPVTYAGHLNGSGSVAVVIRGDKAVGYLCDPGNRVEAWMQGSVQEGRVALSGRHGAKLTGTLAGDRLSGSVRVEDIRWTFSVGAVQPPSGLYRATATVRGAEVIGGWIVLDDGTQVGLTTTGEDEHPEPGPSLDTSTGQVTVDGVLLDAAPVDPDASTGL